MLRFLLNLFQPIPPVENGTYRRRKELYKKAEEEVPNERYPYLAVELGYKTKEQYEKEMGGKPLPY